MHEKAGVLTAFALAVALGGGVATAQKDAAEKAKEGGVDHWIEYYRAERDKAAAAKPPVATDAARESASRPGERIGLPAPPAATK